MTSSLERRWKGYDQPVFVAAYVLNPTRRRKLLKSGNPFTMWPNVFLLLVNLFYKRFFQKDPVYLHSDFILYLEGKGPFVEGTLIFRCEIYACKSDGK